MILALLLLGLSQAAPGPVVARNGQSLVIPREIAPAVIPYLMCMTQDQGRSMAGATRGDAIRAGAQRLLEACRPVRILAETRARAMIRSSRVPARQRERMIADTLSSIDRSHDHIADQLDRMNATWNAPKEPSVATHR